MTRTVIASGVIAGAGERMIPLERPSFLPAPDGIELPHFAHVSPAGTSPDSLDAPATETPALGHEVDELGASDHPVIAGQLELARPTVRGGKTAAPFTGVFPDPREFPALNLHGKQVA